MGNEPFREVETCKVEIKLNGLAMTLGAQEKQGKILQKQVNLPVINHKIREIILKKSLLARSILRVLYNLYPEKNKFKLQIGGSLALNINSCWG